VKDKPQNALLPFKLFIKLTRFPSCPLHITTSHYSSLIIDETHLPKCMYVWMHIICTEALGNPTCIVLPLAVLSITLNGFRLLLGRLLEQVSEQRSGEIALTKGGDDHYNILPSILRARPHL